MEQRFEPMLLCDVIAQMQSRSEQFIIEKYCEDNFDELFAD